MRLGGQSNEGQLLSSPVPTPPPSSRTQEGHLRRRRRNPVGPASWQYDSFRYLLLNLVTTRLTTSGVLSISPRNRTSPWPPSSARAAEMFILDVSRPTKTSLSDCTVYPPRVRPPAPAGAFLVRQFVDLPASSATNKRSAGQSRGSETPVILHRAVPPFQHGRRAAIDAFHSGAPELPCSGPEPIVGRPGPLPSSSWRET
jgi:hypothetical protein